MRYQPFTYRCCTQEIAKWHQTRDGDHRANSRTFLLIDNTGNNVILVLEQLELRIFLLDVGLYFVRFETGLFDNTHPHLLLHFGSSHPSLNQPHSER